MLRLHFCLSLAVCLVSPVLAGDERSSSSSSSSSSKATTGKDSSTRSSSSPRSTSSEGEALLDGLTFWVGISRSAKRENAYSVGKNDQVAGLKSVNDVLALFKDASKHLSAGAKVRIRVDNGVPYEAVHDLQETLQKSSMASEIKIELRNPRPKAKISTASLLDDKRVFWIGISQRHGEIAYSVGKNDQVSGLKSKNDVVSLFEEILKTASTRPGVKIRVDKNVPYGTVSSLIDAFSKFQFGKAEIEVRAR